MSKTPSRKLQTRNKLQEGENYNFCFWDQSESGYKEAVRKSIRLIKKYRHFALFEYASGIRECFDYWTIQKMINGEVIAR